MLRQPPVRVVSPRSEDEISFLFPIWAFISKVANGREAFRIGSQYSKVFTQ